MRVRNVGSCIVENPSFYLLNMGCFVKTSLAKTLLREKRPGEIKEYTRGYKCSAYCILHLTEIKFEVGYIPSVRYFFPR